MPRIIFAQWDPIPLLGYNLRHGLKPHHFTAHGVRDFLKREGTTFKVKGIKVNEQGHMYVDLYDEIDGDGGERRVSAESYYFFVSDIPDGLFKVKIEDRVPLNRGPNYTEDYIVGLENNLRQALPEQWWLMYLIPTVVESDVQYWEFGVLTTNEADGVIAAAAMAPD